jgi:hypothetical protein
MKFLIAGFWISAMMIVSAGVFSQDKNHTEKFAKVQAVFNSKCISCHSGTDAPHGMSLEEGESYKNIVNNASAENPSLRRIAPNNAEGSYLYRKIMREKVKLPYEEAGMPFEADKLSQSEIQTIAEWINSFPADIWGAPGSIAVRSSQKEAPAEEAFLATQLINLPTTRVLGSRTAEFRIMHRWSLINGGGGKTLSGFFGLDGGANTSINLSAALSRNLDLLVRRAGTPHKDIEAALKYVPIQQNVNVPASVGVYAGFDWISRSDVAGATNRFSPNVQFIVGRKFSEKFSALVVPSLAFRSNHNALVSRDTVLYKDTRETFAVGLGVQYQLLKNAAINAEYIPRIGGYKGNGFSGDTRFNFWSVAMGYKVGLHFFEVLFSNSQLINTNEYIPGSNKIGENKLFKKGANFHFGFNIHRQFKW